MPAYPDSPTGFIEAVFITSNARLTETSIGTYDANLIFL